MGNPPAVSAYLVWDFEPKQQSLRTRIKMAVTIKRPLSEMTGSALVPAKRSRQEIVEFGQRKADGTLVAAVSEIVLVNDDIFCSRSHIAGRGIYGTWSIASIVVVKCF